MLVLRGIIDHDGTVCFMISQLFMLCDSVFGDMAQAANNNARIIMLEVLGRAHPGNNSQKRPDVEKGAQDEKQTIREPDLLSISRSLSGIQAATGDRKWLQFS